MKKLFVTLLSLVLSLSVVGYTQAKTYKVKARAGASTSIGGFLLRAGPQSCRAALPGRAKIKVAPKNGRVKILNQKYKLPDGRCKGHTFPILNYVYRGNGKPDYLEISVTSSRYEDDMGYRTRVQKYKINQ